jgi:hypothetical protein
MKANGNTAVSFPLSLCVSPSRRLWVLLFFLHLLAVYALGRLAWPWSPGLSLGLGLCVAWGFWHFHRGWKKNAFVLRLEPDGLLCWHPTGASAPLAARLSPRSTDWGFAIWLILEPQTPEHTQHAWMLLPDALGPAAWRSLRIWLRHKASAVSARKDTL